MPGNPPDRWQHSQTRRDCRRDVIEDSRIDAHGHLRSVGGPGKEVEHFTDPFRFGVSQMEALAIKLCFVRDIRPPSRPSVGIHDGNIFRIFWMSLKK